METLLGAVKGNLTCASVDDLQLQFSELFTAKVSLSKAEHLSATFEFRSDALFDLTVSEPEHLALEGASRLDPSLDGHTVGQGQSVNGH